MAGHSHSANIAIRKGAVDKKRGKLFGKLSRAIIVAARMGGGDPASNLRLRYAIDKARQNSMPRDNIERAVKKGSGELEGESYSELVYEGYGPGGVAILCEILTDNRNRTPSEIRKIFEVHGGNLGATGCVGWMFERKGLFVIPQANMDEEKLMDLALTAGADDVSTTAKHYEVVCDPTIFDKVNAAFQEAQVPTDFAEITRIAANTVSADIDTSRTILKLVSALEDNDDVQSVYHNLDIPEDQVEAVTSGLDA